jgi:hypothetical protein
MECSQGHLSRISRDESQEGAAFRSGRRSDPAVYGMGQEERLFKRSRSKGLVICRDPDPKLPYALEVTSGIDVRYIHRQHNLSDGEIFDFLPRRLRPPPFRFTRKD